MVKIPFILSMDFFQLYYEMLTDDKSSVVQVLDWCCVGNKVVPGPVMSFCRPKGDTRSQPVIMII